MKQLLWTLLLTLFLTSAAAASEQNPWTHSFYFENDLLVGSDSDYTNGLKYSLISPDLAPTTPQPTAIKFNRLALDFIQSLPFIKNAPPTSGHKIELAVGQNMYTPKDISRSDLIEDDRPYAGYSYLASAYHRKSAITENWSQMNSLEIQLGIVGPASLAADAQKLIHRVRDLQRPNGWDHQLKNEPGLTLAFERKWLYHPTRDGRLCADAIFHAGGTAGNIMTYLNGGLEFRYGWNIPRSFSAALIRPAASTWSTPGTGLSLYLFVAANGRLVARDIFLDGNSFRSSHSVDKKYFVGDYSYGLTGRWQRLSATLVFTERSREYDEQEKSHGFSSLSLSYAF